MPRDFEALYRAQAQARTSTVQNETLSLPPGYLVGYDVRLRQDYTVVITAGACNIGGRLVQMDTDHQIADADWVAPKINSARHYYIYLSAAGAWFVDIVAPVWNNQYLYWEQPDTNWRAVGKIFLADGAIIFGIKEVEKNEQTVTVAPAGFTGRADYYCTGTDDQILINAALEYVRISLNGGAVNLISGTYNIKDTGNNSSIIIQGDNITFQAESKSAILILNEPTISTNGITCLNLDTVIIPSKTKIRNIYIEGSQSNSAAITIGADGIVENCEINNFASGIICTDRTKVTRNIFKDIGGGAIGVSGNNCIISENIITKNTLSGSTGSIVVNVDGSNTIVTNNTIQSVPTVTSGYWYGIYTTAPNSRNSITNNHISTNESSVASDTVAMYCLSPDTTIANNVIYDIANTATATVARGIVVAATGCIVDGNSAKGNDGYGIYIATATIAKVSHNYCYNNGSDAGIANTNGNNFYDGGTDTQVYSNSWQQPVAGEPTQGELKWLPQATNTTLNYVCSAVTTTAAWASVSCGGLVPVGTKSIYCTVGVNASSSGAGVYQHNVAFSNDYTSTPVAGTNQVQAGPFGYASGVGERWIHYTQMFIPLDSSLKFYHYARARTNATACTLYIAINGYTI